MRTCRSVEIALMVLAFTSSAAADRWALDIGYGPVVHLGTWAPLRIESPYPGPWTLTLSEIRGRSSPEPVWVRTFHGPLVTEIPFFLPWGLTRLDAQVTQAGQTLQKASVPIETREWPGHVVVIAGLSPAERDQVSLALWPVEPIRVVELPPVDWPQSALAWQGVSAVVVRARGVPWSPAQREALQTWVATGGRFMAVGDSMTWRPVAQGVGSVGSFPSVDPAQWGWRPYGERPLLSSLFPDSVKPSQTWSSVPWPLTAGLVVWTALVVLMGTRGWRSLPWIVVTAVALAGAVPFALHPGDRGVTVVRREIRWGPSAGSWVHVDAVTSREAAAVTGWPPAGPWALDRWEETEGWVDAWEVRTRWQRSGDRVGPPMAPSAKLAEFHEGPAGLLWNPAPPDLNEDEAAWMARVARAYPERRWAVGGTSNDRWIQPLPGATP